MKYLLNILITFLCLKGSLTHAYFLVDYRQKIRDETASDMSVLQGISIVLERNPELRYQYDSNILNFIYLL